MSHGVAAGNPCAVRSSRYISSKRVGSTGAVMLARIGPLTECAGERESQVLKRIEREAGWHHVRKRKLGYAAAAPVAELVNHRDGDRDEQRGQHHQEDHDREEHWISRILRGAESSVLLSGRTRS